MYTYLLKGDVSLSVTMTFFSTLAALGRLEHGDMPTHWAYTHSSIQCILFYFDADAFNVYRKYAYDVFFVTYNIRHIIYGERDKHPARTWEGVWWGGGGGVLVH